MLLSPRFSYLTSDSSTLTSQSTLLYPRFRFSAHSSLSRQLYPHHLILASMLTLFYPCFSVHASLPHRSRQAFQSTLLYPSALITLLYLLFTAHTSTFTLLYPRCSIHDTLYALLHPCCSTHASPRLTDTSKLHDSRCSIHASVSLQLL